ncbi:MAG: xanthine dehydrogenase family protein subunit M [Anaerolineales bacterium]|nr:MAG: xanthine dehydrogenase family protein subunit M [Anaerolineales bacterium]
MNPFEHFTPSSLPEALSLLAERNGSAAVIAGGTDLLLRMKSGFAKPRAVVNLKRIPDLRGISCDSNSGLRLGALTTLRDLTRSLQIRDLYPVLALAAGVMASEQIRSLATLGGNLCNAAPSADLAPPLIALDAEVAIVSLSGERRLPLADFFTGPGKTVLQRGELLKEIVVPLPQGNTVYLKHSPRAFMDIAIVGAAVRIHKQGSQCQQARIVLGAVAPTPLRVRSGEEILEGQTLSVERIQKAAQASAASCSPISDVRGAAWYRKRMVEVLVRRGIEATL